MWMEPSAMTSAPAPTVAHTVRSRFCAYTCWPERTGVACIIPGSTAFAGELRITEFGVALYIGVQRAADAATAATARHDDAVDVEERRVARTEPGEVVAVVRRIGPETDQEASQRTVAFGDAEIFGGIEEAAKLGRIERQDRGTSGIVQCKDGIQLVLAHVADDNRH
jgi:hypothetical protein